MTGATLARTSLLGAAQTFVRQVLTQEVNPAYPGALPGRCQTHPDMPLAREAATQGWVTLGRPVLGVVPIKPTNAGARMLIQAREIRAAELAGGAGRMLAELVRVRRLFDSGQLTGPGEFGGEQYPDTPHNRAALLALAQARHVEMIDAPEGQLRVKATDAGMEAR